jgi:hypothetical protein
MPIQTKGIAVRGYLRSYSDMVKQISQATFSLDLIELMAKTGRSNSFVKSSFKVTVLSYKIGGVEP